ncbi:NAD(P)/FAD-dependent oxidoreductase [soil metagenome]
MKYDLIIIGGGAAGLFCALQAGRRGKRALVIEHNAEVGRKIVISGGGRCNFTNIHTTPENFISRNPHFCKSALSQYTPGDFVELVRRHKISYFEKKLGQLFCRESSRQIVEMLLRECREARVEVRSGCSVTGVTKDVTFIVETSQGRFEAGKLVIACGGLSFAKIGASDLGYRIARQFGLKIVETRPSLVAMVIEGKAYPELAGVSVDAFVSCKKNSFRENILFTHRGLSGPAILQISNYWNKGEPVKIDLLPDVDAVTLFERAQCSRKNLANFLGELLPQRFAGNFATRNLPNKRIGDLTHRDWTEISEKLSDWQMKFRETEGYDRAEVTIGGVSTDELSSKTMESKKVSGLYFIGEVVDVTGWLGGYNFQWAWSSGYSASSSI